MSRIVGICMSGTRLFGFLRWTARPDRAPALGRALVLVVSSLRMPLASDLLLQSEVATSGLLVVLSVRLQLVP